jgi:type II restriction/modification system DNA methylase subunit YeeA
MTPADFIAKWRNSPLNERAAYQLHFCDLCALVGHDLPSPQSAATFRFEQATEDGFADVWKRGFFGLEYKGPGRSLDAAYAQLLRYREALESPPLLVVCDTDRIEVHTNFTNTAKQRHVIPLAGLAEPANLDILRAVFTDPERLRPGRTRAEITEKAAGNMAAIFDALVGRAVEPQAAAHFLMKLVFCFFAEDVRLLPEKLLTDLLAQRRTDPARLAGLLDQLFAAMATGGDFGRDAIDHFNGGLFDEQPAVALTTAEIDQLVGAAALDWSQIEPSIFGSLFEGALSRDPQRRQRLGAHYTSRADILRILDPVLLDPLRREWAAVQVECDELAGLDTKQRARRRKDGQPTTPAEALGRFRDRLARVRVLDPACGSGNFLYVALAGLLDLERDIDLAAHRWGVGRSFHQVGPQQLFGLDIEPFAVELARLTVSIGYLQWLRDHANLSIDRPLLQRLESIRQADAILNPDDTEPAWPECDVIVGNPPFLGDKMMRAGLGDEFVERLRRFYGKRVPGGADLCCYWFERARAEIAAGRAKRAGLLATNSIRQGRNRVVLDRILDTGGIFMAWADEPWILDGAAVRISMIGFDNGTETERSLDGVTVGHVNADLTSGLDLTSVRRLPANARIAFLGSCKGGPFDITVDQAEAMLAAPLNPNGRPNSDVVRPYLKGGDAVRRQTPGWIIDFAGLDGASAALYQVPFEYARAHVYPHRAGNPRKAYRERWWIHQEARPGLRAALAGLAKCIVTPEVSKYRLFVWLPTTVLPDHKLIAFAREDDYFFGVLHSRPHEAWSLRMCSTLEDRPSYTPTACFETFPFPDPAPAERAAIAAASKALAGTRQAALDNDPKRTLTGLYNERPTWLANLHAALDAAVLTAYGWPADLSDDELLGRLLALNHERAAAEGCG